MENSQKTLNNSGKRIDQMALYGGKKRWLIWAAAWLLVCLMVGCAELLQEGRFEALLPDRQGVLNTPRDKAHRAPPFEAARRRAPRGSRSSSTMEIAHSGTVEDRL